jgi:phosphoglycolate phosphatase-like HAD superfamily hydrolase
VSKPHALVLFDIDGTLIRGAGPHHKQALIAGIRQVTGLETHLDGVPTAGMLDRDLIAAMLRGAGASERRIRAWLGEIVAESQRAYVADCPADLGAFVCPGAREFIQEVSRRGAVLGLVTGNLTAIGWRKVELAGLRDQFSLGAFAEDGKTRARLAQVAAHRAVKGSFVKKPPKVTLIGDHLNDVAAAQANGFQSVAVATGVLLQEELRPAQPDFLVGTLAGLDPASVF